MSNIASVFPSLSHYIDRLKRNIMFDLKVSFPAIVNKVNANGTIDVQPAIRERKINEDMSATYIDLPIIPNVPVIFPSTSAASIKMPITIGDECLVIIADNSFDNWWLNGGIQNPIEQRRHDLTDAFAIPGARSLVKGSNLSDTLLLQCGSSSISVSSDGVKISGKLIVNDVDISSHTHKVNGERTGEPE